MIHLSTKPTKVKSFLPKGSLFIVFFELLWYKTFVGLKEAQFKILAKKKKAKILPCAWAIATKCTNPLAELS